MLSVLAGCVTALFFFWAMLTGDPSRPVAVWFFMIGLPPIALSVVAAVQYRWRLHSGAGAAAAVVYWVFVFLFNFRAGQAFFIGALLQTFAWYISRPGKKHAAVAG